VTTNVQYTKKHEIEKNNAIQVIAKFIAN